MIKIAYIFLLIFVSIFVQVLIGSIGLIFPIAALSIFYLTIINDWETGIVTAIIAGLAIDILYKKPILLSPVLLIIIIPLALLWVHKGDLKILIFQAMPAGLISFLYIAPQMFVTYRTYEGGFYLLLWHLLIIMFSVLVSSIIFPLFVLLMDKVNFHLKLNLYRESQKRILKEH